MIREYLVQWFRRGKNEETSDDTSMAIGDTLSPLKARKLIVQMQLEMKVLG